MSGSGLRTVLETARDRDAARVHEWVESEKSDAGKEIGDPTSIAISRRGSVRAAKNYYSKSISG